MGSTGSGRFSDYTNTSSGRKSSSQANSNGGNSGNSCESAIGDIELEEVARCDYFVKNNSLPEKNSDIHLNSTIVSGRLAIIDDSSKMVIGFLPTQYNYLFSCMASGYVYKGIVISSVSNSQHPRVWIDIAPFK